MYKLNETNPAIYNKFMEGYHVVKRSDAYWAGLSTDLVIEQELMRSVKATGGLTHGRGMTELQRAKWLLSTPACLEVKRAMEEVTGMKYKSSEQHKEATPARIKRDYDDSIKVLRYVIERNPFEGDRDLINIETGEVSDCNVNVYNAKDVGNAIIKKMVGQAVLNYSYQRKNMAVIMKSKSSIVSGCETIPIDHQLLFQRLLTIAGRDNTELESALHYELCTLPSSLLSKDGLMREANNPVLGDTIWKMVGPGTSSLPVSIKYVLDGGSLLQRLTWRREETFQDICHKYVDYVVSKYGTEAITVFDGYPIGPTTKDTTHLRRSKNKRGKLVKFSLSMKLSMDKEKFLANKQNKQEFLRFLISYMNSANLYTKQSFSDADVLIAKTAIDISVDENVVVIGEDTDLLILLLHYCDETNKEVFLTTEQKVNVNEKKLWDIRHVKRTLGQNIMRCILPIHDFLGCDTTSRVHSLGKGEALKRYIINEKFQRNMSLFNDETASYDTIASAGEELFCILYGAKCDEKLNKLRFHIFCKKAASS